jgi:hypothetical protein
MLVYALIGLVLVLTGVTGLQFAYLFYHDRMDILRRKHVRELEKRAKLLAEQLHAAEEQIAEQKRVIKLIELVPVSDGDNWADVIDEL